MLATEPDTDTASPTIIAEKHYEVPTPPTPPVGYEVRRLRVEPHNQSRYNFRPRECPLEYAYAQLVRCLEYGTDNARLLALAVATDGGEMASEYDIEHDGEWGPWKDR